MQLCLTLKPKTTIKQCTTADLYRIRYEIRLVHNRYMVYYHKMIRNLTTLNSWNLHIALQKSSKKDRINIYSIIT